MPLSIHVRGSALASFWPAHLSSQSDVRVWQNGSDGMSNQITAMLTFGQTGYRVSRWANTFAVLQKYIEANEFMEGDDRMD